jgi:argininosuccinate lyase
MTVSARHATNRAFAAHIAVIVADDLADSPSAQSRLEAGAPSDSSASRNTWRTTMTATRGGSGTSSTTGTTGTKLWSKGYEPAPLVERFEAGRNAPLDAALARYDIWGSLAHAHMLHAVGLIGQDDWQALHGGLRALLAAAEAGGLRPTTAQEDVHTAVEQALTEQLGAAGKMLHTGRSRNDQVLLDLRLYARDQLLAVATSTLDTAGTLLALARRHEWTPMPGYTHMQRAMLSSVGLWAAAFAEALLDDLIPLSAAYALNDQSPLGSAAAYGVPLPLDRALVARLLGFGRVHHNTLTAANARGKTEAAIVGALALVVLDLGKWAQDVLLFATSEFAFVAFPAELTAGSSIMPQKRNLDALELIRARAHTVAALQAQMLHTLAGLPSGYNMDYQETKAPLFEALSLTKESLQVVGLYAANVQVNEERLRAACAGELFATDRAYELARAGVPFRDAYRQVAIDLTGASAEPDRDLVARLHARSHEGAPGNLALDRLAERIARERAAWAERQAKVAKAIATLVDGVPMASDPCHTDSAGGLGGFADGCAIALGI